MALPRIDDKEEAEEYGIETFPAMVYFDKVTQVKELTFDHSHQRIPNLYSGELDTVDILVWMTEQTEGSHIEAVSDEILAMLIR